MSPTTRAPVYAPALHTKAGRAWITVHVDDDWTAVHHLALQDGRPVVAALAVYPRNQTTPAGEWTEAARGVQAEVPRGGLTSRLLRHVPLGAHVRTTRALFRRMQSWSPMERGLAAALLRASGVAALATSAIATPSAARIGRPPVSTAVLLRVARLYAAAVARGSRQPVADVAARLNERHQRMSSLVHMCRLARHALLTPVAQGRAGGELTDRARALLKRKVGRRGAGKRKDAR